MYKCKCGGMVTDCIGELEDSNNPCICKDLKIESQAKEIEGLRELIENIKGIQTYQLEDFMCKYKGELLMDEYSDGYVEVEELRELLKEVK